MNKYAKFDKEELKELQRALRTHLSELSWNCKDETFTQLLLNDIEQEMGERFNSVGNTYVDEE